MSRKLAARTPMDYDSSVDGKRQGLVPQGNFCLNTGVKPVSLVTPFWDKGSLKFRAWPQPDYSDPSRFAPGRTAADPDMFTHWHIVVQGAYFIGLPDCPKHTFNLYPPKTPDEEKNKNPYRIFYRACQQAFDNGEFGNGKSWPGKWNRLMKGGKTKGGKSIDSPKTLFYFQGHVYQNGERVYIDAKRDKPLGLGDGDSLPVILLKGSGGFSIVELCNLQLDEYEGDAEVDYSAPFVVGDPVGKFLAKKGILKGGCIFEVFNPNRTKLTGENSTWDGKIADTQGYEAAFHRKIEIDGTEYRASMSADDVKRALERCHWWMDDPKDKSEKGILRFAEYEQQAIWVAQSYKDEPKLLAWAWGEEGEEYLKLDDVKGILANRVSAVMPGKDDDDEDEGDEDEKPKHKSKKTDPTQAKKKAKAKEEDEDDEEDEFEDDEPKKKKKGKKSDDEDDEDDEDDDADDDDADDDDADDSDDDDSDEDDSDDDDDDEDEDDADDSDDEDDSDDDDDDEEDEDEESAPKKGKAKKGKKADDEDEEDEDDEDDDSDDDDDEEKESDEDDDSDDDEGDDDSDDDDSDDDDEDDDDEDDEDDEDDDDDKPAPKKGKAAAKSEKSDKSEKSKPSAKSEKAGKGGDKKTAKKADDEDYFGDDDAGKAASKSMKAAKEAKDRSANRASPKKEAPKAPASKGGTAKKKK